MLFAVIPKLTGSEDDYEAFFAELKSLGPWSDRLHPTLLVECGLNTSELRNTLKPLLQPRDRLLVVEVVRNWAATNMGEGFPEWLGRRTMRRGTRDDRERGGDA